ncbi:hypothetical protein [Sphaerisporangium aureirubrum]|uniref:Uncharacterized protein n=1 Tax=Sphaerisporangium aureirubrum TaxID=1544736 RepID=A0ABW1NHQ9_9ACTN
MSVAYEHYPELHGLIERLRPEQAEEVRAHVLRLVEPPRSGLRVLRVFDGPAESLGAQSEEIIHREAGSW